MKRRTATCMVLVAALAAATYFNITIFVVQPIGAVPEGRTLVMSRLNATRFIDSADSVCMRPFFTTLPVACLLRCRYQSKQLPR